ncbi:hypothetical protein OV079_51940 [Nannocystis pusilla]|uniref:Uncharacterized protein n=1 Tax=Nannocystis pusilla TaxID=889268 RepID=A0A9X3J4I3_9BACT|nr:hypothetical protein [Nannocystis pusilla]MCY1013904.1 hypothetical protein [Nannocystis pusilla]
MSIRNLSLALLVVTACTERPLGDAETSAGGQTTETTTAPATTLPDAGNSTTAEPTTEPQDPVTSTTAAPDPGTTGNSSNGDITPPDGGGANDDWCDPWVQDCPEGQKCMPWSGDGDSSWESLKCVDVVPNPDDVGEPCMVFGSGVSGEDTCDVGQMCWNVVDGVGTCIAMCVGSPEAPSCESPGATCHISGEGILNLCLPNCDPLKQDCPGGDLCLPNPNDPANFLCVLDASGERARPSTPANTPTLATPVSSASAPSSPASATRGARLLPAVLRQHPRADRLPRSGSAVHPLVRPRHRPARPGEARPLRSSSALITASSRLRRLQIG